MTDQAKKTDAWMPLWIGDYLADTMGLTTAEHGAYLLLLFSYWRSRGPLKDDDRKLAAIVKATPAEWKRLRPTMLEFFDAANGVWTHTRAEKELAAAGLRAKSAHDKAKKAAEARWAQKNPPEPMPQASPEHAPSIAQAQLEDCPSPSPSPGIGIPTLVAKDQNQDTHTARAPAIEEKPADSAPKGTKAGQACFQMRRAGLADANPAHPKLIALIDQGMTTDELVAAAADAVAKQKGFAYALAVAEGRRREASAIGPLPKQPAAVGVITVPSKPGRDPVLEQIEADSQKAVAPSPEIRERLARIRRGEPA